MTHSWYVFVMKCCNLQGTFLFFFPGSTSASPASPQDADFKELLAALGEGAVLFIIFHPAVHEKYSEVLRVSKVAALTVQPV